jgi:hypothetical protein
MLHISYQQLSAERTRAAAFASMRYTQAEAIWAGLPAAQNLQLLFGPIKVGDVTFTHTDRPDTKMDLYLWRCEKGHATLNYQNGALDSHNLRIQCHCNNCYYFSPIAHQVRSIGQYIRFRLALRRMRNRRSSRIA